MDHRLRLHTVFALIIFLSFTSSLFAGFSVYPRYIVLDASQRMVPLRVNNTGSQDLEVSVEVKYGYVISDDSGKPAIVMDTLSGEPTSAAEWIKPYPERFILPFGEIQTVRLVAYPPPGLPDGEYWARIIVTGVPRKPPPTAAAGQGKGKSGLVMTQAIGLPVHYRKGNVSTGVEVTDFRVTPSHADIVCSMNLTRTGNASFAGRWKIRFENEEGKVVSTSTFPLVVFKSFFLEKKFSRDAIPTGRYTVQVEIVSDGKNKKQIPTAPVRLSMNIEIP
ncbi:MAG: molecular chaperone [Ignavibacteriae bacterium]|nr:molecular chaperone [Ignavibacteriota bacterium]